jgi:ParB family chromosome partitioning protein
VPKDVKGGKVQGRGLGRGLAALMDEMGAVVPGPGREGVSPVAVDLIDRNPQQPRRHFDETALEELAASIRTQGILQPLLLRPRDGGRFEIVAGERRWRAAQKAGLHEVPAVVREMSDGQMFEAALIENVQRHDLNPIEESDAYVRLKEAFGHTQERIAELTGKSRSHIANLLRLQDLPPAARSFVITGELTMGHAKLLLSSAEPGLLAIEAVQKQMTVRELEKRIQFERERFAAKPPRRTGVGGGRVRPQDPNTAALERDLTETLGMAVMIREGDGWGEVTVRYQTMEQMDLVIERLQGR